MRIALALTGLLALAPAAGAATIANVHNAPGWLPSHAYTPASTAPYTRVVSGPAWNGTAYTSGLALSAYQLTGGACTSGSTGPTGTGTAIAEGTCTWRYLSPVDYVSFTGWSYDNALWTARTYPYSARIVSGTPPRAYEMVTTGTCASTVAPTGAASLTTSDGCQWLYKADIIYSSRVAYMATELIDPTHGPTQYNLQGDFEAHLWNDREYLAGANGENGAFSTEAHHDYTEDTGGPEGQGNGSFTCSGGLLIGCYHITVTTAPGESFRDTAGPLGLDASRGVTLHETGGYADAQGAINSHDQFVIWNGLQVKSDNKIAFEAALFHSNQTTILNSILEGGSPTHNYATVELDSGGMIANSLIVSHGKLGVWGKYGYALLHSTVVNPDHVAGSVGATIYNSTYDGTSVYSNAAVFGFAHAYAYTPSEDTVALSSVSNHNATDASASDSGTAAQGYDTGTPTTVLPLPGAMYGIPFNSVFAGPGDYRLSAGSPLRGRGCVFGVYTGQGYSGVVDTPDIVGTARAQDCHFDIGAWQRP